MRALQAHRSYRSCWFQCARRLGRAVRLAPAALGIHVTVFDPDPDPDPDSKQAALLTQCLTDSLTGLGTALQR